HGQRDAGAEGGHARSAYPGPGDRRSPDLSDARSAGLRTRPPSGTAAGELLGDVLPARPTAGEAAPQLPRRTALAAAVGEHGPPAFGGRELLAARRRERDVVQVDVAAARADRRAPETDQPGLIAEAHLPGAAHEHVA